jgi:hypothetical protein
MKVLSQTIALLLGLALLAALGLGGYRIANYIVDLFTSLDFQVARITAIASVVALLASIIIARGVRASGKQNQTAAPVGEKTNTYRLLIDFWYERLGQSCGADDRTSIRSSEELRTLERSLALYGSPSVIKAHITLRALERDCGANGPEVKLQFAKVLVAMRKDLGSQTAGLSPEDLQQLLFTDSDKAGRSAKTITNQDGQPHVALTSRS